MKYVVSGKKLKSGVKHDSFDFTVEASSFSYNAVRNTTCSFNSLLSHMILDL